MTYEERVSWIEIVSAIGAIFCFGFLLPLSVVNQSRSVDKPKSSEAVEKGKVNEKNATLQVSQNRSCFAD